MGGTEKEKKEKEEKEENIPLCGEGIGQRPLWGRCPKMAVWRPQVAAWRPQVAVWRLQVAV